MEPSRRCQIKGIKKASGQHRGALTAGPTTGGREGCRCLLQLSTNPSCPNMCRGPWWAQAPLLLPCHATACTDATPECDIWEPARKEQRCEAPAARGEKFKLLLQERCEMQEPKKGDLSTQRALHVWRGQASSQPPCKPPKRLGTHAAALQARHVCPMSSHFPQGCTKLSALH